MSDTCTFPSDEFPGPPSIALERRDGWSPTRAPGAVLALVKEAAEGHFAPNVTVLISRLTPEASLAGAVDALRAEIAEFADSSADEPFPTEIGGREFTGCNVAFRHPEAGTLVQVHLFTAVDHNAVRDAVRDVVHLTGTCSAERASTDYAELQALLGTCTVRPWEAR